MAQPRLLLIDDEPTLAEFLASAARESGFDSVIAVNDEEFRSEFLSQRPDMVALDLGMPGMDGVALLTAALRHDATDRVGFYEDFYALGSAARRRHPVTGHVQEPLVRRVLDAPGWVAPLEGLVLRATPLLAAGPSLPAYLPGHPDLTWRPERHPVDDWCQRRQLAAVAQYASQTPALGGMRQLGPLLRRAHRVRGGDVIWSVRPR